MTPAVLILNRAKVAFELHEYAHDRSHPSYGMEAAEKLQINPHQVFKTLMVNTDEQQLLVAMVPVSTSLNLKQLARLAGVKKVVMAEGARVERATGYVLGGVSPLGQKTRCPSFIDASAFQFETLFVSAGRRGLEIELSPHALCHLLAATAGPIATPA
jgi:Cys-tRNA(Pro)/Cys-tRNA(Cys) deacylase